MKNKISDVILKSIAVFMVMLGFALTRCKMPEDPPPPPPPKDTVINIVAIQGITVPTNGGTPVTAITENEQYNGTITWSPDHSTFAASTQYTATITLTAKNGYTFTGLSSATINGQNAKVSNNTGVAVTLSYTFPATSSKRVTSIAIKTQPAKMTYKHSDKLDLTGLVVTLTYDDTSTENVASASFTVKSIIANPAQNASLVYSTHNRQPVTITYGNLSPLTTDNLIVSKASGIWVNTAVNTTYTPTLTLGDLTLPTGYVFTVPTTTKLYAGNSQSFAATYTNPDGNYETANGNITVNVAKSGPASWPTASAITYGTILSASILSGGDTTAGSFAWTNNTIFPAVINSGCSVTFTPFDTANYAVTTGMVAITVNKAVGEVAKTPTLSGYAHNGILINAVISATGQSIEYGISTSNNANTATWQSGLVFTGLNTGTTYYIFARTLESANYNTGTASGSLQVTTRLSNVLTVTDTSEWNNALTLIANFGSGTANTPQTYTITISGNIWVSGSTNPSFGSVSNVIVTLNGNGKLSLSSNGNMIRVNNNQTLIIDSANIILQGRSGSSNNNTSLIYCSGTLELQNGIISGNTASVSTSGSSSSSYSYGGGVYVSGTGTFNMKGGIISGNTTTALAYYVYSHAYSYGGGVYVGGAFNMTGGTISGNTASADGNLSSYSYGGGVYVGGTFNMTGGNISGNTSLTLGVADGSLSCGGGVYLRTNSTFTMTGGTISDNMSNSYNINESSTYGYGGGGGVYASGNFIMKGGIICGNTASSENSYHYYSCGGGVNVNGTNSTFTMTGGVISGNTATNYGGGVYFTNNFIKTGGIIYGSDASSTDKNTAMQLSRGHAVYYAIEGLSPAFYRSTTINEDENLYSTAPLPANSGQTLNGWTKW